MRKLDGNGGRKRVVISHTHAVISKEEEDRP
jgi:hypothetical protein